MQSHIFSIYVPSTIGDTPAPQELTDLWISKTKYKMAQLFGGFTSWPAADGGWVSGGKLIEEKVTIVQSFGNEEDFIKKTPKLKAFALKLLKGMSQQSVMVVVDNAVEFIKEAA